MTKLKVRRARSHVLTFLAIVTLFALAWFAGLLPSARPGGRRWYDTLLVAFLTSEVIQRRVFRIFVEK
jgi:uncharacterized membrane protein YbhN (UPF0104 family)